MEKFDLSDKTIFDFQNGEITSLGGRMALVHVSLLYDLMGRMQNSFGPGVWDTFYDFSKKSAVRHAYRFFDSEYVKKYLTDNDLTADHLFALSLDVLKAYGLGSATIASSDLPGGEAEIRLSNSSTADFLKRRRGLSSKQACHYTAGFIAGFASVIYGEDLEAKEEKCIAMESDACVFKVFPSGEKFSRVFLKEHGTSGVR